MASKRRYTPIVKYPYYSRQFDRLRLESEILTPKKVNVHSILWDRSNLEGELKRLNTEYIPYVKGKIKDIEKSFSEYQRSRVLEGREKLTEMPEEIINQKFTLEAKYDVYLEEIEILEQRLKVFTDKVEKVSDNGVLAYGLRGSACFHGLGSAHYDESRARAVMDGQNLTLLVKENGEEIIVIDDKRSKFHGMDLPSYRKLIKLFAKQRIAEDEALLLEMQKEAKIQGNEKPWRTGKSFLGKVSRSSLPDFPSWAKNHLLKTDKK